MSFKGYQFFNKDNTKVEAVFLLKDRVLSLFVKVSDDRLKEIKDYIEEQGWDILGIEYLGA